MKIWVYFIGKPRDAAANSIAQEYVKRTSRYASTEMREIDPTRFNLWQRHPAAARILLDPGGKPWNSGQFTSLIKKLEDEGRDAVFLVGGHAGLPDLWRPRADLLLSLSPMTFPHELARVMLTEQIYRAFTTLRDHPYPR